MATTISHEIRESGTALYVERVSASKAATPATNADRAEEAVGRLEEMAADVRGCALLDAAGEVLAASGDAEGREDWAEAAESLLAAADAIREEPAAHIHVGAAGDPGPVVVGLFTGAFDGTDSASGCIEDVDPALVKAIRKDAANYYVNVHSSAFPAGAIRGQLG